MTQGEARIAAVFAAVANRKYTVAQLKQTLAEGLAYFDQLSTKWRRRDSQGNKADSARAG